MAKVSPQEFRNKYTPAFTRWLELLNLELRNRGFSFQYAETIVTFLEAIFPIRLFSYDDFINEVQGMAKDFFESNDMVNLVGDKNLIIEAAKAAREAFDVWQDEQPELSEAQIDNTFLAKEALKKELAFVPVVVDSRDEPGKNTRF